MLALVNTPTGNAPVELRQVPEPAPGLHEALVAVQAFSLNRGELRSFRNNEEGWIPGQDISGIVLLQAADGSGPPAGTRIVALMDEFGWAERAAVPTQRIAVLPDPVSFAAAAALPVAGLTALRTLRHGAPLLGKRVLITGAAGGVGHLGGTARRAFRRARHCGSGTEGTRGGAAGIGCDRRGGRHRASARAVRADPRIRRRRVVGDGVARSGREWRGGGVR